MPWNFSTQYCSIHHTIILDAKTSRFKLSFKLRVLVPTYIWTLKFVWKLWTLPIKTTKAFNITYLISNYKRQTLSMYFKLSSYLKLPTHSSTFHQHYQVNIPSTGRVRWIDLSSKIDFINKRLFSSSLHLFMLFAITRLMIIGIFF